MNLFHISAECYPVAKSGGLGDVVGALPKVQKELIPRVTVVMPFYDKAWFRDHSAITLFRGTAPYGSENFDFEIREYAEEILGFRLLAILIPGLTDRPGVYIDPESGEAYWDELKRFLCFQIAFLEWLTQTPEERIDPTILHCHDHHSAMIPFMSRYCERYSDLSSLPNVLTIHNGEYQGRYDMNIHQQLPHFPPEHIGLLEWDGQFNSLACGIKCAWRVTTVSAGYMEELKHSCQGLESLLRAEEGKTLGILNGIDTSTWDPSTDPMISVHYQSQNVTKGKQGNKEQLLKYFNLAANRPLFSFIGRLVHEKGADLLPDLIRKAEREGLEASFLVLGTGDPSLQEQFSNLKHNSFGYFDTRLEYNEQLAHLIYAGSDFLLMPSRVEPCGLNQLYAMRYGTIPIVRATGGLKDTVLPIHWQKYHTLESGVGKLSEKKVNDELNLGRGFVFDHFSIDDVWNCIVDAVSFWSSKSTLLTKRRQIMKLDFSWYTSAKAYSQLYDGVCQSRF